MMNYIGMYLVNMMIQRTVYDQVKNQTMAVADGANLPKAGLDKIVPGYQYQYRYSDRNFMCDSDLYYFE